MDLPSNVRFLLAGFMVMTYTLSSYPLDQYKAEELRA